MQMTVMHFRTRQETGSSIDGARLVIKIEFGQSRRQIQIGFIKRANRPDVGPIVKERVTHYLIGVNCIRNDVLPEIICAGGAEDFYQQLLTENINTHGSQVGFTCGELVGTKSAG